MGVYRCSSCGYLAENTSAAFGSSIACPKCTQENLVYDTTAFVRKVLEKYVALRTAYKRLQAELENQEAPDATTATATVDTRLEGIDLHNTSLLSTDEQHRPIQEWFDARKISVRFNHAAIDTSGFYDEVALELGRDLALYKPLLDQIRYAQTRGFAQINVTLDKRSQKEAQAITAFCRKLYEFSFLGRFFHQKTERNIRLTLQGLPQIRDFFAGGWLEWFALMEVLSLSRERSIAFSCARNLSVVFPNEDLHELDLFWLVSAKQPICIECKTGEFRQLLPKYSRLRKRLGLAKDQFVLCVAGLPKEQATGLSSMHDLAIVSERGLKEHLASLI